MGQTSDLRVKIRVAEESYRLTPGGDNFEIADLLRGRGDDAVEGRTQDIVAPAGEKIGSVDDDCAGLRREIRERMSHVSFVGEQGRGQGEGAYDWRCWLELLRRRVFNLESANLEKRECS